MRNRFAAACFIVTMFAGAPALAATLTQTFSATSTEVQAGISYPNIQWSTNSFDVTPYKRALRYISYDFFITDTAGFRYDLQSDGPTKVTSTIVAIERVEFTKNGQVLNLGLGTSAGGFQFTALPTHGLLDVSFGTGGGISGPDSRAQVLDFFRGNDPISLRFTGSANLVSEFALPPGPQNTVTGPVDSFHTGNYKLFLRYSPAVPEPDTWLLMTAGLGLAGLALRRRRAEILNLL